MSLRPALDEDRSRLTPFVDREDELDLVKQIFARAVRETSTQLVTITGEAGVGKSRLASEFLATQDERPAFSFRRSSSRWSRCLPRHARA